MPMAPLRPCRTCGQVGCQQHGPKEADRDNVDVRRWYRTARWTALKQRVRAEQPLCDECQQEGRVALGTQTDHTVPHRGNPTLFWDRANLRNKCEKHHGRKTRRGL